MLGCSPHNSRRRKRGERFTITRLTSPGLQTRSRCSGSAAPSKKVTSSFEIPLSKILTVKWRLICIREDERKGRGDESARGLTRADEGARPVVGVEFWLFVVCHRLRWVSLLFPPCPTPPRGAASLSILPFLTSFGRWGWINEGVCLQDRTCSHNSVCRFWVNLGLWGHKWCLSKPLQVITAAEVVAAVLISNLPAVSCMTQTLTQLKRDRGG